MKLLLAIIITLLCCSSCSTLEPIADNTKFTYDIKKGKLSAKTKVNKYLTIKY